MRQRPSETLFSARSPARKPNFAVLRDGIACKPAVLAETDDWVAMASEYRAIADLPGVEDATIWEPKPAVVYTWKLN